MTPRIHLVVARADGRRSEITAVGEQVTDDMRAVAEDLLHTLTTGTRPPLEGLYELCARAFDTSPDDAKQRLCAAMYGMDRKQFDARRLRVAIETPAVTGAVRYAPSSVKDARAVLQAAARKASRRKRTVAATPGRQGHEELPPMQPIVKNPYGVLCFRANAIIRYLIDQLADVVAETGQLDLTKIAALPFPYEDREQFEQLQGSIPGGRPNAVVRLVVEHAAMLVSQNPRHAGRLDLNKLAELRFPQADLEQFAQLMGYSIAGYHELSYVSDASAAAASRQARAIEREAGGCRDEDCQLHCDPQRTTTEPPHS